MDARPVSPVQDANARSPIFVTKDGMANVPVKLVHW